MTSYAVSDKGEGAKRGGTVKVTVRIDKTSTGYRAVCPALPGCVECGGSRQEAMERIAEAVRGYFASMDSQQPVQLQAGHREYSSAR